MTTETENQIPDYIIPNWISSSPDYSSNTPFGLDVLSRRFYTEDKISSIKSLVQLLERGLDIDSINIDYAKKLDADIRCVMDIFSKSAAADSPDWLNVSAALGFPSHSLSGYFVSKLNQLRVSIFNKKKTEFTAISTALWDEAIADMLELFVSVFVDNSPIQQEKDISYIACSGYHGSRLIIGVGNEDFSAIQNDLNDEHKLRRAKIGFLATWLVHDVQLASDDIKEALGKFKSLNGVYDVPLPDAKRLIQSCLRGEDNFSLSPWHSSDSKAFSRIGI